MSVTTRITCDLEGGGPWGIKVEGGDGEPLKISEVEDRFNEQLKPGDTLLTINDEDCTGLTPDAAMLLIDGATSDLKLEFIREGPPPEGAELVLVEEECIEAANVEEQESAPPPPPPEPCVKESTPELALDEDEEDSEANLTLQVEEEVVVPETKPQVSPEENMAQKIEAVQGEAPITNGPADEDKPVTEVQNEEEAQVAQSVPVVENEVIEVKENADELQTLKEPEEAPPAVEEESIQPVVVERKQTVPHQPYLTIVDEPEKMTKAAPVVESVPDGAPSQNQEEQRPAEVLPPPPSNQEDLILQINEQQSEQPTEKPQPWPLRPPQQPPSDQASPGGPPAFLQRQRPQDSVPKFLQSKSPGAVPTPLAYAPAFTPAAQANISSVPPAPAPHTQAPAPAIPSQQQPKFTPGALRQQQAGKPWWQQSELPVPGGSESVQGKGARMFAKRQQYMDQFVVEQPAAPGQYDPSRESVVNAVQQAADYREGIPVARGPTVATWPPPNRQDVTPALPVHHPPPTMSPTPQPPSHHHLPSGTGPANPRFANFNTIARGYNHALAQQSAQSVKKSWPFAHQQQQYQPAGPPAPPPQRAPSPQVTTQVYGPAPWQQAQRGRPAEVPRYQHMPGPPPVRSVSQPPYNQRAPWLAQQRGGYTRPPWQQPPQHRAQPAAGPYGITDF